MPMHNMYPAFAFRLLLSSRRLLFRFFRLFGDPSPRAKVGPRRVARSNLQIVI